ncbi:uncharacterized protein B0P05DRAFT_111839 [Gilbertella persicaria]|uniref:uncharacterized protein n=1 Tax=Gilbertella persicaria TaxID=101096 RepID=UPI0022210207|nr:uncharacterized protein B0P05DRAFT_111839 [Gilbertella persicaria]KAI8078159.1 hypothetical protein B0P05DRAFT_111839 [Gilbertella persicaria]
MYRKWEMQTIQALKWYPVTSVIDYLHKVRTCIIHDKQLSLESLLCCAFPARKTRRFPMEVSYLCEGIGDWHLKLGLVHLFLHSIRRHDRSVGHIHIDVLWLINDLLRSFETQKDVITRSKFEARYQLIWEEQDWDQHDVATCDNPICHLYSRLFYLLQQWGSRFLFIE